MEHWEIEKQKAEQLKIRQSKFQFEGKKVRRKGRGRWEEGIVVVDKFDDTDYEEEFIKFGEDDLEQLFGLPFQVWDEENQNWEDPFNN
jgi:hypothetical protein